MFSNLIQNNWKATCKLLSHMIGMSVAQNFIEACYEKYTIRGK